MTINQRLYTSKLSPREKLLMALILKNGRRYAFYRASYVMQILSCSRGQLTLTYQELVKKGYIFYKLNDQCETQRQYKVVIVRQKSFQEFTDLEAKDIKEDPIVNNLEIVLLGENEATIPLDRSDIVSKFNKLFKNKKR